MLAALFGFDVTPYLPYAVGVGVATAGFGVAAALAARGRAGRRRTVAGGPPPDDSASRAAEWESPASAVADRRSSVRREGAPVKVFVTAPAYLGEVHPGWVLDRSTGGLRLAVDAALPPGTAAQVRAENAPDTIPWVTVLVRSCKDTGEHFELGCSFEQTPPWNVLLLFG
jgi:hypothetical protein